MMQAAVYALTGAALGLVSWGVQQMAPTSGNTVVGAPILSTMDIAYDVSMLQVHVGVQRCAEYVGTLETIAKLYRLMDAPDAELLSSATRSVRVLRGQALVRARTVYESLARDVHMSGQLLVVVEEKLSLLEQWMNRVVNDIDVAENTNRDQ